MKEISTAPPLPDAPPAQDFTTALNYLVCIAPIVYMAFQARPASSVRVQLDSGMGCESRLTSQEDSTLKAYLDKALKKELIQP
ncbi:hypothetical protein DSO57_1003960 [Entomophthora muscae]|uniref:Uncharacterized protein n=1 Tax=Entomophthora muscae TaxID=34485 RepID=A0ACC2TVV8_9FUNG|nr:hypothetical protein DSO57_1003960 [Entomophthora muscae]